MKVFFILALFALLSGCSAVERLTKPEPTLPGARLVSAEDFVLSELLERDTLEPGDDITWYRGRYGFTGAGRLVVVTPPWQVPDQVVRGRDGRTFLTGRCAVVRRMAHDPRTGTEVRGESFVSCRTFRQAVGPTPDERERPWRAVASTVPPGEAQSLQPAGHTAPAEKDIRRETMPPATQQEESLPPPLRMPDGMFLVPRVPGWGEEPRERPVWEQYPGRRWEV
jgi:hypothetical protein